MDTALQEKAIGICPEMTLKFLSLFRWELNIAAWVKYQGQDPGLKASRSL